MPIDTEQTDTTLMRPGRQPGAEPIPGYRLIAPLGRGGFGEVWKCEAPGGLLKAIKFVHGGLGLDAPADDESQAIGRVKAIRHPFLLSLERVEQVERELVIVMELADRNLGDVLAEQQQAGQPGIPREPLLGFLREAAEALDLMNQHYGLQHLDIKPGNLFQVCNHVKVGDFGLVQSIEGKPSGLTAQRLGAITPVYAAPELFENVVSRHSDQYSLAIVYQELLTGTLPFAGKNVRQLMLQHTQAEPDLQPLPQSDRAVVARALARDPQHRFPSCTDFIHALLKRMKPEGGRMNQEETMDVLDSSALLSSPSASVSPAEESLSDLRMLGCLRRTPLTEVHKAQRPDGSERLVTILFGHAGNEEVVAELSALHHPTLVPFKAVFDARGSLALISLPPRRTLRDRFQECVSAGSIGLPREELLGYLGAAASALDFLHQRHAIAHLGLNPRNLFVEGDRLSIADFGLAQLLWLPAGQAVAKLNTRYSAPELSQGQAGSACDQYSLALIYHEMLTGALPDTAPDRSGPRLDRLPEADRAVIARALLPDASARWGSCTAMVHALSAGGGDEVQATSKGRPSDIRQAENAGLQAHWGTALTREQVKTRLDGFRQRWKGTVTSAGADELVYWLPMPQNIWQRWTGRQPGLAVSVHLDSSPDARRPTTKVNVQVQALDCGREQKGEVLEVIAPLLVESLRSYLQGNPRGRHQERLAWHHPLQVCSVLTDGTVGTPIECQGKDISLAGIGFYLPGDLPAARLSLQMPPTPETPARTIPARVVRVQSCGEGWYEVGAIFLRPEDARPDN